MSTNKRFTEEQMQLLMANPYVKNVTSSKITYSLEFKKKAVAQAKQGMKSVRIFKEAGLGEDILGKTRIYSAMKAFKREAFGRFNSVRLTRSPKRSVPTKL